MEITVSQLAKIRKQLNKGGLKEIAKRAGKSYNAVLDVFLGRYKNLAVVAIIIEVAKEHKAKRLQMIQEMNEVLETNE